MSKKQPHEDKGFLSLAGEFAVASELNRRHVLASVTYGASKCSDIFALNPTMTRTIRIEVKATTPKKKTKWLIGPKGIEPVPADLFWVLVLFPDPLEGKSVSHTEYGSHAPRFFVLLQEDICQAHLKEHQRFIDGRGGRPYDKLGVPSVILDDIKQHEGQWRKIISRLKSK